MLKDELPKEMRERWHWDRNLDGVPVTDYVPRRELTDIKTTSKQSKL